MCERSLTCLSAKTVGHVLSGRLMTYPDTLCYMLPARPLTKYISNWTINVNIYVRMCRPIYVCMCVCFIRLSFFLLFDYIHVTYTK